MNPFLDEKNNPWVMLEVKLSLKQEIKCLIDTGFSGGLALPNYYQSLFDKKISLGIETYEFANGEQVSIPQYEIQVKLGRKRVATKLLFIDNGCALVGLSFLKYFAFNLDLMNQKVVLDVAKEGKK